MDSVLEGEMSFRRDHLRERYHALDFGLEPRRRIAHFCLFCELAFGLWPLALSTEWGSKRVAERK